MGPQKDREQIVYGLKWSHLIDEERGDMMCVCLEFKLSLSHIDTPSFSSQIRIRSTNYRNI